MFLAEQMNQSEKSVNKGIRMRTEIKMRMMICLVAGMLFTWAEQSPAATEEKPTVMVSLSQLNTEIRTLRENLSRTIAALENVKAAANKDSDLSKPFANFSGAWTEFEKQVTK